jgi:hypothetical protein
MPRSIRLLFLAVGAVVLGVLVRQIGVGVVVDLLRRVGWGFAAVSALYAAHLAVRAAALWRCLPPSGFRDDPSPVPSYAEVLRVRLAGEAVEMLTFSGPFLAEPAKGWLLTRHGLAGAHAFGAVAIEYLLYTVTSAWIATAALSMLVERGGLQPPLRGPVIGIIVAMIIFTLGFVVAAVTGVGLIVPTVRSARAIVGRRAVAAAARIDPVERVLIGLIHERPARLGEILAIEAVGQALLVSEIWIVVHTLGFPFTVTDSFVVEGAVKFVSIAFFFVPGQLGASESVYTLVAAAIGLSTAVGLTVALVRRVRGLLVASAGGLILFLSS